MTRFLLLLLCSGLEPVHAAPIGREGSIVLTAMAPDGRWILYCQVEDGSAEKNFALDDYGIERRDVQNRLVDGDGKPLPLRVDLAVARDAAGRYLVARSGDTLVLYDAFSKKQRVLAGLPRGDVPPVATFDAQGHGLVFPNGRGAVYLDLRTGQETLLPVSHATLDPGGDWVWAWPDDRLPGGGPPWGHAPCERPLVPGDAYTAPTGRPGASLISIRAGQRVDASNVVAIDGADLLVRGADGLIRRGGEPLVPCAARLEHVEPVLLSCGEGAQAQLFRVMGGGAFPVEGAWYADGQDHPWTDRFLLHHPTSDAIDTHTGVRWHLEDLASVVVATDTGLVWQKGRQQMAWTDLRTGVTRVDPREVYPAVAPAGRWTAFPLSKGGSITIDAATGAVTEQAGYALAVTTDGRALLATPGRLLAYPPRGPAFWGDARSGVPAR